MPAGAALLADIGGTNVRFALLDRGEIADIRILPTAGYPDPASAAQAYLKGRKIASAAFAIAAPPDNEPISLTNSDWEFSRQALAADLGIADLHIVNDFTAQALALPLLGPEDCRPIGPGRAVPAAPMAVLGPGTGLGVSGLVPDGNAWIPLSTEGGHVTLPARTPEEDAVIAWLRERFGHISAERALSGPGLVNLMNAISGIDGNANPCTAPAEVTAAAAAGDPQAVRAVSMFCEFLGTVAGDIALTFGAAGGIYISGGIVPKLGDSFDRSGFRARFEDKGRFSDYLRASPTCVVTAPCPALTGLRSLFMPD